MTKFWVRRTKFGWARTKFWSRGEDETVGDERDGRERRLGEFLKGYMRKKLGGAGVGRVILRMAILAALLRRATKRSVFEARISGA
jgi:hypothetical protein